ncbi:MAG: hypothetical protein LBM00_00190 [Deltaproteobacteria bacterium]|jgi:photosystem II stability/assembly factor-like uncharacterized protein|nr:hypothetical protein [Deltaproteobacteria bacterium]
MARIFSVFLISGLWCSVIAPAWAGENVWHKIALDKVHIVSLTSDPARPSTLYAATSVGVQKSMDNGSTWAKLGGNLPEDAFPNAVLVNPLNSKELYVSYDGRGIFKSSDSGNTWQAMNEGLPNLSVRCMAISPKDPNLLYIGIMGGVAISTNGGKLWHMSSGFKRTVNVNAVSIDPKNPQFLYAGTGGAGVFKSGNGGVSWIDINQGLSSLSITALHIDPENPDIVLAGAYHPATPTDFYVGEANGGVFRTSDGGRTWNETTLLTVTIFSFAAAPEYPEVVYTGAWGGAYRSVDRGESWVDLNEGLDNAFLHKIFVIPSVPPVILAGTTFGLLSYTDARLEKLRHKDSGASRGIRYGAAGVVALALAGLLWLRRKRKRAVQKSGRPVW